MLLGLRMHEGVMDVDRDVSGCTKMYYCINISVYLRLGMNHNIEDGDYLETNYNRGKV